MTSHRAAGLSTAGRSGATLVLLAAGGFLVNLAPAEIFPGIHFVFGGALALVAAVRYGSLAGFAVGLVAALPTWPLWNQPFPFSALLYGLEGAVVGHLTRSRRRGVLAADLAYWLLLGSWLNLAFQVAVVELPFRIAFIIQCRSILNGLLVAMAVELGLLVYGLTRRPGSSRSHPHPRPTFQSLVTLLVTAMICLPILWITVRNARSYPELRIESLRRSAEREVEAIRGEVGALTRSYSRGVGTAAEIVREHGNLQHSFLQGLLEIVARQYPEFAGLYVADAEAETLAFVPLYNDAGESLVGLDFSDREYYRQLLAAREVVYSGVYQARGGMSDPAVAIGAPVLDDAGELQAFVLGWFDVSRSFHSIVERFDHAGASVVITDREGRLIAHSGIPRGRYTEVRDLSENPDFQIQGWRSEGVLLVTPEGRSDASPALAVSRGGHILAFTTEPVTGWRIWTRQPLAPIQADMVHAVTVHLLVLVGTLLVALALSAGLARVLASPLERLRRSAERLAGGDLSARPEESALGTAETDSLVHSFSAMAGSLDGAWRRQEHLLEEVTRTKRELEATFDAMNDAVVITDADDRIVHANEAFLTLTELHGDAHGKSLREIGHPDGDWSSCRSCTIRLSRSSDTILLAPEENVTGRPIEVRVDPIHDDRGEVVGAVQVMRDLTELRRWEAEAERAEALLRNFVEAAYDAVFVLDFDGRLQYANYRTLEVFGLGRSPVRGRSFMGLVRPEDRDAAGAVVREASAGEARRQELRLLVAGSERHVLLTLSPVYVEKEIMSLLGIARDVTDEKTAAERARRDDKLRALGQLAAGVAHNFNNALTAVLGYTQIARSLSTDPRVRSPLETVEVAALDAANMVRRIQQFARSEKEEPLREAPLDDIVRDAIDLTRSRWETDAQAAGIRYDLSFSRSSGQVVACDPSALREVFVNLIINALDAMPGGGRLTLETAAGDATASVTVTDDGCGMSEEVRERIFDPFFTTKGATGQGMGLAVSYGTVQRHRGQIHVASEPGLGSRITVILPVRDRQLATGEAAGPPAARETDDARLRESILVVEDEEPIRSLLELILSRARFRVATASDGLQAVRRLGADRFDLILTDLAMPGADGLAVAREARHSCPAARLIVMTGYGEMRREVCEAWDDDVAVDAWISKPFDTASLVGLVEQVLGGSEAARDETSYRKRTSSTLSRSSGSTSTRT